MPRRSSKTDTNKELPALDWAFIETVLGSTEVRTVYLYGPPGIGKTFSAYHAGRVDDGVYAITLTEDTPAAELRGHYLPRGREMYLVAHGQEATIGAEGAAVVDAGGLRFAPLSSRRRGAERHWRGSAPGSCWPRCGAADRRA